MGARARPHPHPNPGKPVRRANGRGALVSPANRLPGPDSRQIFYVGNSIKHCGGGGGGICLNFGRWFRMVLAWLPLPQPQTPQQFPVGARKLLGSITSLLFFFGSPRYDVRIRGGWESLKSGHSEGDCVKNPIQMLKRGKGVKKYENLADILNGSPSPPLLLLCIEGPLAAAAAVAMGMVINASLVALLQQQILKLF